MESELANLTKTYEKLTDREYLDQIEEQYETQTAEISHLEKENNGLLKQTKKIERQLDK